MGTRRSWARGAVVSLGLTGVWLADATPTARAGEPSAEYQAGIKRAMERRRQRRQARATQPVGMIVPYPMPPALVIKHTPQVHDEVADLLRLLRGQP